MLCPDPGQLSGFRVTKLTSTAAQMIWNKLSCRDHNGVAVGYMYELSRHLQHSRPALSVMFGIINGTALDLNNLVPFTNYTVSVRFANHLYEGPRSSLNFVTFEDCEYLMFIVVSNCIEEF